jgi:hypothetical protein
MEYDIKKAKATIDVTSLIGSHMLREEDSLRPQLPLFPKVLSPPEEGVEPEYTEDRNEEAGHQDEGPIEHWFSFWIGMGCMGDELNEVGIGSWMALTAGLYQAPLGDEGLWIIWRQNIVKSMAVGTACYQFRVTQMLHFSMITFIIGLRSDEKNTVSFHHLYICMAFLANLCMEFLPKRHGFGLITF